jgi:hypothetical protein
VIPLTVIGGFLGAGKTTLVNRLLTEGGRRFGVLVNDFGAINVDQALIAAQDGETLALTNGCVCCMIGDDFGAALLRLAERGPEHVLVEASGVADPWRIAQLALVEPGFSLEPIVVLADATSLADGLADRWVADTLERQLRAAELVVLTKRDIATDAQRAAAVTALERHCPTARRIDAAEALQGEMLQFPPPRRQAASRFEASIPPPFRSTLWRQAGPLDMARLRETLAGLPRSVLRIKGVVMTTDGPRLLQYAAQRWAFSDKPNLDPALVIIGTPDMPDMVATLEACTA